MICPKCGIDNHAFNKYCIKCKSALLVNDIKSHSGNEQVHAKNDSIGTELTSAMHNTSNNASTVPVTPAVPATPATQNFTGNIQKNPADYYKESPDLPGSTGKQNLYTSISGKNTGCGYQNRREHDNYNLNDPHTYNNYNHINNRTANYNQQSIHKNRDYPADRNIGNYRNLHNTYNSGNVNTANRMQHNNNDYYDRAYNSTGSSYPDNGYNDSYRHNGSGFNNRNDTYMHRDGGFNSGNDPYRHKDGSFNGSNDTYRNNVNSFNGNSGAYINKGGGFNSGNNRYNSGGYNSNSYNGEGYNSHPLQNPKNGFNGDPRYGAPGYGCNKPGYPMYQQYPYMHENTDFDSPYDDYYELNYKYDVYKVTGGISPVVIGFLLSFIIFIISTLYFVHITIPNTL